MQVQNIMHKGIETAAANTPVRSLAQIMKEKDVGAIPVMDGAQLIGIVTDRDIAMRAVANGHDLSKTTARDIMSADVAACHATDTCEEAVSQMTSRQVRRLPVLDGKNKPVGIISLGDISHAVSQELTANVARAVSAHHG